MLKRRGVDHYFLNAGQSTGEKLYITVDSIAYIETNVKNEVIPNAEFSEMCALANYNTNYYCNHEPNRPNCSIWKKMYEKRCKNENVDTTLFNACCRGNKNLVQYLIELGHDINKENKYVQYLFELRADINKENKYGETPLFNACKSDNENLVQYLIELGVDIKKENIDGKNTIILCMLEKK
ncbi:ankyrin repeat-containing domain protein [Neocallimastix sp. 'constans']